MKVFVARDKTKQGKCPVFSRKPHLVDDDRLWESKGISYLLMDLEAQRFKRLFGFTPRKGSCRQMELSLKEIE